MALYASYSQIKVGVPAYQRAVLYAHTAQALGSTCTESRRSGRYPLQSLTRIISLVISVLKNKNGSCRTCFGTSHVNDHFMGYRSVGSRNKSG